MDFEDAITVVIDHELYDKSDIIMTIDEALKENPQEVLDALELDLEDLEVESTSELTADMLWEAADIRNLIEHFSNEDDIRDAAEDYMDEISYDSNEFGESEEEFNAHEDWD